MNTSTVMFGGIVADCTISYREVAASVASTVDASSGVFGGVSGYRGIVQRR